MARLIGTFRPDLLPGTAGDDLISGRGGGDSLDGRGGFDRIFGGRGDDFLTGAGILRGGPGRDEISGSGILRGDDGNDRLFAALGDGRGDGEDRLLIGGRGADEFRVNLCDDGLDVRVEVLDFRRGQGDRLYLDQRDADGFDLADAAQTFAQLDRNHDRVLDADDGGRVHTDPAGGLALEGPDGDAMILVGRSFALSSDFLLG